MLGMNLSVMSADFNIALIFLKLCPLIFHCVEFFKMMFTDIIGALNFSALCLLILSQHWIFQNVVHKGLIFGRTGGSSGCSVGSSGSSDGSLESSGGSLVASPDSKSAVPGLNTAISQPTVDCQFLDRLPSGMVLHCRLSSEGGRGE